MTMLAPSLSERKPVMRGRALGPAKSDFGQWLIDTIHRHDFSLRGLAAKADISHARLSQYIGGEEPPRAVIERVARAFVPEGLGAGEAEETYQQLVNAALRSAGFLPATEYEYPAHKPLHSIIREIGLDEKQFSHDDLEEIQSGVESFIEGYAVKKQRQVQGQKVQVQKQMEPRNAGQPKISQEAMKDRATRLTRETRARDPRVRRSEAIVWALGLEGRFLMSDGDGLEQAHLRPGQVVGLRIWDVYQGEDEFLEKVRMALASDGLLEWTTAVRGVPWRCMTEPLRNAEGTKIGIVGTSLAVPTISESHKQA